MTSAFTSLDQSSNHFAFLSGLYNSVHPEFCPNYLCHSRKEKRKKKKKHTHKGNICLHRLSASITLLAISISSGRLFSFVLFLNRSASFSHLYISIYTYPCLDYFQCLGYRESYLLLLSTDIKDGSLVIKWFLQVIL